MISAEDRLVLVKAFDDALRQGRLKFADLEYSLPSGLMQDVEEVRVAAKKKIEQEAAKRSAIADLTEVYRALQGSISGDNDAVIVASYTSFTKLRAAAEELEIRIAPGVDAWLKAHNGRIVKARANQREADAALRSWSQGPGM